MSIYATIFDLDDDNHEPGECAVFEEVPKEAGGWDAATADGHFWRRVEAPCTCGNRPPLIYRGSHVNPSTEDPRGGVLLVCGIPDHCHPAARWDDEEGRPVEFLRFSAHEAPTTFQGREPGQATLVLDLAQVVKLRDVLAEWIDTRDDPEAGG